MACFGFSLPSAATATGHAGGTTLATVSLLHNLQPIAAGPRSALRGLGIAAVDTIEGRLEREGRVAVFEGCPDQAHSLERALRALGLSISINLRSAEASALRRPWRLNHQRCAGVAAAPGKPLQRLSCSMLCTPSSRWLPITQVG
jgi:hypothetical protein